MIKLIRRFALTAACALAMTPAAHATFPPGAIDCAIFDLDNENFIGSNFGFATNLSYNQSPQPPVSTGFQGFVASPEQVSQIPDFISDTELTIGGLSLAELFGGTTPDSLNSGFVSQTISGAGDLSDTFSFQSVSVSQRSFLDASQDSGGFADIFAEGKAYFPFDVVSDNGGPVDVDLLIDLFTLFNTSDGGFLSEALAVGLVDLSDPENPMLMDYVEGFYFADSNGVDSVFERGVDGENDISDSFFSDSIEGGLFGSFFYEINTTLQPGNTYAIGITADSSAGLSGLGSSLLDSTNTLNVTIDVASDGGALVLPGFAIPEPATGVALGVALLSVGGTAEARRRC